MNKDLFTTPVAIPDIRVHDSFFSSLMQITVDKLIPYQWKALNDQVEDAEPSHCLRNFKIAAGMEEGEHKGFVFQDSDLAKWIEAAAYSLMWKADAELEKTVDEAIEIVEKAQLPDGYLDTYYILTGIEKRWTNTKDNHEMYCAGHMLEAAVAYYKATGKDKLLQVMIRFIDHIAGVIGPEEGKLATYPGHEVLEMAMVKLYEITEEEKHLRFASYLIDQRGQEPSYFVEEGARNNRPVNPRSPYGLHYFQADRPVRQQEAAEGHAVRAGYLYSGMADVARATMDDTLLAACRRIWGNIVNRQMYITGTIGQSATAESFSYDYDLPNDLVYGETCAAISLAFFAQRMLRLEPKGEYGDVLERVLYNGSISGMSLDGTRFFYVNPLEVTPERCEKNYQFRHVKPERQKWFGCACCPPNLGRLVASLPGYIYHTAGNTLFVNLYTTNELATKMEGGAAELAMETGYPWNGAVRITVQESFAGFVPALRKPGWCRDFQLRVNGSAAEYIEKEGFVYLQGVKSGDIIELFMDMPVRVVRANPRVQENIGKIAITRGPVVYCLEEPDNGKNLQSIYLSADADFSFKMEPALLGGVVTIDADACELTLPQWQEGTLYSDAGAPAFEPRHLRFIPYYAWANRGAAEMTVWVREKL